MNKNALLAIGISIIIDIVMSMLVGLATYLMRESFWVGFLIAFVVIFVLGNLWNVYLIAKDNLRVKEIEAANNLAKAQQEIQITCAACKRTNAIPITLEKENHFNCVFCQQENVVMMSFSTAITTTPLTAKIDVPPTIL